MKRTDAMLTQRREGESLVDPVIGAHIFCDGLRAVESIHEGWHHRDDRRHGSMGAVQGRGQEDALGT
jgi:hypothetical protein